MWEENQIVQLLLLLDEKMVKEEGESVEDNWSWRDDKQLAFFVKFAYNSLKVDVGGEVRAPFEKF